MMRSDSSPTWANAWRLALLATTLGMGVGFFEGAFLRHIPRVTGLQQPDVSDLVLFVAPLGAAILFGLVGLALGVCVALLRSELLEALAIASLGGLAAAYLAASVQLNQARSGWLIRIHDVRTILAWFLWVFSWALLASWILKHQESSRFRAAQLLLKPWAALVGTAMAILALGASICANRQLIQLPSAKAKVVEGSEQPNIVLIVWDTARADHVSAYGYERRTTPHLDQLAAQGMLFENAISPSSWTLPSFSSMFTGLLPHQHGANANAALEEGPQTLAQILGSHGYETAGFNANIYYGLDGWGIAQGFETYVDGSSFASHSLAATVAGHVVLQPVYERLVRYNSFDRPNARQLNDEIYAWYGRRSGRPYFLFVNYFDAHRPYSTTPPYDRRFGHISKSLLRRMDSQTLGRLPQALTQEEQASVVAAYDNCLAFIDGQFGELLRFLSRSPDWANTYVIVTADHGDAFGEHGLYDHGWTLYRELIHVPLIIVGPGIPQAKRVSHIARTREIFSTVLDIAFPGWDVFRRTSLRRYGDPAFQPQPYDEMILSELIDYTTEPRRQGFISMMTPEWHYLHLAGGGAELYNWSADPLEMSNLADSPQGRRRADELNSRLYDIVSHSFRPWRGLAYLLALDSPRYSILREANRSVSWDGASPMLKIGMAQARFRRDVPAPQASLDKAKEDLLMSIPYE